VGKKYMAKKKNWVDQLAQERYFVWAAVFAVIVAGGLLGQISLTKIQLDTDMIAGSYLVIPHKAHTVVHRKK